MTALTRLLRILTRDEKARLRGILVLAVGVGVLETLAVLSVLPFMAALADPERMLRHPVGLWMTGWLDGSSERQLLLFGSGLLLLLVLAANLGGIANLRSIHLTSSNISHYISRRLLAAYLSRPYIWFLDQHSSGMKRSLLHETEQAVSAALVPLLYSAARGIGSLLLVTLLLMVDVRLTLLFGGALASVYALIYLLVRSLQERLGRLRADSVAIRFRVSGDALGGIKEVKSLGAERELLRRFDRTGVPYVRSMAWGLLLAEVPRHLLEVLSIGTVLLALLFFLESDRPLESILPTLSLLAFAGYKLVPSLHVIVSGIQRARFSLAALEKLENDLDGEVTEERSVGHISSPIRLTGSLRFKDVTFRYPGSSGPSLEAISFTVQRGERIGVVGPSGAGKTTLADVLLGLLIPQEGSVQVDGLTLSGQDWVRWRASIGYVPQSIFLSDSTLEANIAFGIPPEQIDRARVVEVARLARLHNFIEKLPLGYQSRAGHSGVRLSGGERQRIGIARALYRMPSLLLLDEATSALDTATEQKVMEAAFLLDRDCTVVIVTHRLETVRPCDRILVLDEGRLAATGTWDELLETSDLFRVMARRPVSAPSTLGLG